MEAEGMHEPALTADQFTELLARYMPQVAKAGMMVDAVEHGVCRMRMLPNEDMIRAGGTISGPSMFALSDLALYGATLSMIGPVALAVTSSMTINFLRKPAVKPMIGEARIIRLGRRLAYGEVFLRSEGEEEPVAHATGSYAIPSARNEPVVA